MSARILFVDDDESILAAFQRSLRKQFEVEVASGTEVALAKLAAPPPFAVVVADMQMPEMNGIEFLKVVQVRAPETVRIMLTGNADQKTAVDAVNEGHVFRFLTKPCDPDTLTGALKAGLRQYQLVTAERELLEQTLRGAIRSLSDILRAVQPKLAATSEAQYGLIREICAALRTPDAWATEVAAMLVNVGYVTLPPAVMLKTGAGMVLNEAERNLVARLPETSSIVVGRIPRLEEVARIILYSRKDFDGAGFPVGDCCGAALPIGSRILRAVSDFLLLQRRGLSAQESWNRLRLSPGVYDPEVIAAGLQLQKNSSAASLASHESAAVTSPRGPRPGQAPLRPPPTPRDPASPAPEHTPPPTHQGRRLNQPLSILVVDQHATIVELIRAGLSAHPWTIMGCADASEALAACRRSAPDIVLLSLALPDHGAFELLHNLRAEPATAGLPILGLCVRNAAEAQAEAHRIGFNAIVHKPIEISDLETKIIHALNLDTSERYFAQGQGALRITLPAVVDAAVATEVILHFTHQLETAVDAGIHQLIVDLLAVRKPDLITIQLGSGIARHCQEMGMGFRVVGGEALAAECLKYEETSSWEVMTTLEEALSTPMGSHV